MSDVGSALVSGGSGESAASNGDCVKHDQGTIDRNAVDDKCETRTTSSTGVDRDAGNKNSIQDEHIHHSRELNFLNLKLQCMCSDDDESVIGKSNIDASRNRIGGDDETEIEISDVEAVTEIGESIFENHRCTHCGRDHCCFFLRCCYCIASSAVSDNDGATDSKPIANANQSESDASSKVNSNNIPNALPLDSCAEIGTSQNLASKLCDEYCKIIRNKHRTGECGSTTLLEHRRCCEEAIDGNDKQSTVTESITIGCHCRWYCIQDCDSDAKPIHPTAPVADNRPKCDSTLAVQEPEIVSPIANELPLSDENRLRCCRCSKELI